MTATIATAKTAAKVSAAAAFFAKTSRAFQVHGANTEVGKTIFSTVLLARNNGDRIPTHYIKPVSTGPAAEEDLRHIKQYSPKTASECLVQYKDPVSPHLAVMRDFQTPLADSDIVAEVRRSLTAISSQAGTQNSFALVESAGGVLSPGPSGSLQADIYRPLRLPALLVGDAKLGGISATISAYESLFLRGFDVPLLLTFKEDRYRNFEFFQDFFAKKNVEVAAIPAPPPPLPSLEEDVFQMQDYYSEVSNSDVIKQANDYLTDFHKRRLSDLQSIKKRASETIWYPFSQHSLINQSTIIAIDSAYGDFFQSFEDNSSSLEPLFDASASWWTQGLGHGNPDLALTSANAAGRYGHVILANTIHEPALKLAEKLLALTANPRLSRVFYSDNGSTGVEVGIKMAFKAACARYNWAEPETDSNSTGSALRDIGVLGLKRSYHGDTIGTMDCCEPSVYNKQVNWYRERGAWLEYPVVKQVKGRWVVENLETGDIVEEFNTLQDVFSLDKRDRKTFESYKTTVLEAIKKHLDAGKKFGALLIEPVLLGAGGMMAVDPLFQNALVTAVRENAALFGAQETNGSNENDWQGLPVIFDEVFTGLFRLGHATAASLIQVHPDITVNAKLLTGGLLPLCTTMASNNIFEAFLSAEKVDGLLHGHSYTAHPVGCAVAAASLDTFQEMSDNGAWNSYKAAWDGEKTWSMWEKAFVAQVSHSGKVDGVFSLGSVLAITLKDDISTGYASNATEDFKSYLEATDTGSFSLHIRGLGNVIYIMTSQSTEPRTIGHIQSLILDYLKTN